MHFMFSRHACEILKWIIFSSIAENVSTLFWFVAQNVDADASGASAIYCAKGNELLWNVNLKQRNRSMYDF